MTVKNIVIILINLIIDIFCFAGVIYFLSDNNFGMCILCIGTALFVAGFTVWFILEEKDNDKTAR